MAVYTLSPSERRARAQAVKARRENRYSYSNYIEEHKKAATAQADAIRQAQIDEENEKKNQSFIVRGLSTIGDLAANVITGAVKGLEGIYDLGAGIVGGIGGIFDKDFQNSVQEHIAYDWTTETIGNPLQELTKYSYLKDGGIIEGVASGVGQMLPAVAVTVVTGGLGAPAAVAQGASLATLGVSAAGNATEQAYNDGAGYWQGLGYGVASGAVEVATEKLGGGLTGNVFGRGLLDGVGKTVADTGFKRIVKGALEEGAEEVISELANPALKSIYKGKSAFEDYKDPEYWKGVGEAGLVGGMTALAYGGTVGRVVNSARGINEDISESIAQVETLEKKRNNLFADDRLTQQTDTKIADGIRANYQNVETALKKASDKNRAKFIKNYRLSEAFDTDGSMKPEFAVRIGIAQNSQNAANTGETVQADTDANGAAQTPLASLDTRYYHPSLRGQEQKISEQLARQGTKVYSGELTATEQANYSKFKKAFNALSQKGLVQPDFVIAESSENFYSYLDGKTVVIGKDALESDIWQQKIIHEVEHFTEGTKEWSDFASFVFNETDTSEAVQSILRKNYGITQADVDSLPTALAEGNLTDNQRLLVSEVVAEQSEVLLGNEQTIQRLATTKRSLARKLYDRIKNFIKVLKAKTPEEKTLIKKLEKAQQLFEKALDKAGAKYIISQVDAEGETQYNKKGLINNTFPTRDEGKGTQANELATIWAHRDDIKVGDQALISFNDRWYLIEKFDDSDWNYQIIKRILKKDYKKIVEDLRKNGTSGRVRSIQRSTFDISQLDKQRNSSQRVEPGSHSVQVEYGGENQQVQRMGQKQTTRRQITGDGNRNSESSSSSGQRLKYSLKEVKPVKPSTSEWRPTINTDEALERFPNLWNVKAEKSEIRNPTQIKGTVSTYRKIYEALQQEGFNGNILDASSGLGYGTRAGVEDFGFNVEDIEPYPGNDYKPKYTDYSALTKKYDVIVSNAVLNVLPQDQRDALVVKMGELLNDGGRIFVNVRGDDVNNLSSNPNNIKIGEREWYVAQTGSYQKGFTKSELVSYLRDALGEDFRVESTSLFGKTAAVVTKLTNKGNQQYSLKVGNETITGAVEESGRLVALHNLSEEKLLKVLQLGGFPMPSIAITRADMGHDQFGDITVIFGKDTIDPQRDSRNKVFSRDGYTPTVPKVEYKVNEKAEERIHKKYYELARKYGYEIMRPMYKYANDLDGTLNNAEGEISMLSEIYDNTGIMQIYLLDTGKPKIEPIYREVREEMTDEQAAHQEKLISAIGRDAVEEITYHPPGSIGAHRKEYLAKYKEKIVDFYADELFENLPKEEGRKLILDSFTDQDLLTQILYARNYLHNGKTKVKTEYDSSATDEAIRKAVPKAEYEKWVDSLFGGVEEKQGIRNDKDPFTPSGNRRSFEATHDNYTLENLVRAMEKAPAKGNGGFVGLTANELAAKLAKEFKSVSEIRKSAVSLKAFNQEIQDGFVDTAHGMINEIESLLLPQSNTERMTDWSLLDGASLIIGEIADKGYSTEKQIADYMAREYANSPYRYTKEIGDKILSLFQYVRQMSDTDYFEAKPRRAVGFNEILRVLLPEGTNARVTNALDSRHIPYEFYKEGESRSSIIQKMDDVQFSRKDSEGNTLTEQQAEYFRDSKVRDENGNLLVVYHGTMTGDFTVFDASYANVEGDMGAGFYFTSDYADVDSNYEHGGQDFEAKIERLAERIESDEDISYDEAKEKARERLAKGSKLFEVYLDIKNPAYVGGNFDEATILSLDLDDGSLSVEDFESEDAYEEALWEAREESLQELYQKVESILEREGITGYEEWTGVLSPIGFFDGGTTITELKEALNDTLYDVYDENGNYAVNEVARAIVEALGYDGIIDNSVVDKWGYNSNRTNYMEGIDEETRHYIVFRPNQIKLTTNQTPTLNEDIRYSLKDKYFYQLTDGQIKKILANNTKFKVYSKADAESIVNNVLGSYMAFGDKYGDLRGKSKKEVVEILWRGLNTADPGKQASVALDVAEYIIQHSAMENLWDDTDNQAYIDTISVLKPYLHNLDLSSIRGEIKYRYDKDNSPYLIWGKRRGEKGQSPDVVAQELAEQGFYIEATNEADIFFEIDSAYRNALQSMKKQARQMLNDSLTKEQRAQLKQEIAREVLKGFDYTGKPSTLSKIVDKYAEQAKVWKQKYLEERSKNRAINRLLDKTQKLKDLKLGTFLNASQFKSDIFKGSIEKLAAIKYRGNLNQSGTRKIVAGLAEWYSKDNPILEGVFDEEVRSMLEAVATGEGNLTVDDVKMLDNIVGYFTHFVETYNKVYRNGKYVDAKPIAEKFIEVLRRNKNINVGILAKLFGKVFNNPKASYIQTFSDPMTVVRFMDRYDDGFYTEIMTRLREGAVNASVMEMEMREPLEEFYKKHKSYIKGLEKRTVQYQGKEIPVMQAMLLYMTLNREQALAGLAYSGFTYENGKETVRVEGFATEENLSVEELKVLAQEQRDELSKQFNETDKEYIGIAEKLFNEDCKEAKRKTDILRKGYTNVLEDYYVPIRRANIAHSVDTSTFFDEMNRVSNASFNKDTVRGAKGELFIESLDSVLDRHIHAISQYANLSTAIDEYDKLFNIDVSDNPNKPTSVKTESVNVWKEGDLYFKKLISDIQGVPVVKGEGSRAMAFIRSGYAKFQLGANPKVWVTQLSSFAAAGSILDVSSITKGIGINGNDVDEYCPLAKVRNSDNTVAMAQGVIDNVGKVGDVLMKPIGKVDRFVIKKLFGACQVQIEKNGGAKVGTKENKQAAGELLTKVILETQQNALATERSAAMRSGSEIMKTLTMFSSDAMKVIGRVIDSVGELSVLKHRRKSTTDAAEIETLDKKIKAANTKVRKSVAALAVSAAFMALVAQLFRWLYNKDDEEDVAKTIAIDAAGNLLGGLPIFKDIYARLVEGYDLDNYAYSTLNNLLDSAQNIFDIASDIATGNTDDIAKNIRNIIYAAGQLFGIPVRNIYNVGYGLINRFSPSTAYKIDDMFYNKNYRSDLNKAIEEDDDEMIATIVGVMLDENIGAITSSAARKELDKLTKAGYDVIPRAVSETITYDGEEMALTGRQVSQFNEVYSTAHEAVASLVAMSQYGSATEDVQAKAINFIYDVYYNLALEELLGVDLENKNILFAEAIDIEKLALIIATARAMTADTDNNGNAISGTRKAKIQSYINSLRLTAAQKYMIMGYLGYSNTMGETQVKSYINRLSLTSDEKKQLLQYSGYAA